MEQRFFSIEVVVDCTWKANCVNDTQELIREALLCFGEYNGQ